MIRRFALLQTFVAVARAGKMKRAANELALTPGAVSQRIRQLEEVAGRRLFNRVPAGVELNAAGEAMFTALAEPFRAIEAVDRELGGPSSSRVTMSTMPSFAATWLVPRLAMFAQRYPDIEIAVETGTRPVDLRREPIDLAIRHGLGKYPGFEATWLVAPELIVVASPDLLKDRAPLKGPADCLAFPLLHDFNRQDWPLWFEAHGVAARTTRWLSENAEPFLQFGVFGKPPGCARGCRGTRVGASAGYLRRGRPSIEEAGKAAHGELACAIRLLRGRDIRNAAKACGPAI